MTRKILGTFLLLLFGVLLLSQHALAEGKEKKGRQNKPQGTPTRTFFNINNISTYIYNDGNSDIDPDGNSGVIYPKGSGKGAVFESGLVWGAKITGDPQVRVGGSTYNQGLRGGRILPNGTAADPNAADVRIYRVRPDVKPGGPAVDLTNDARLEGIDAGSIRAQYEKDWTEWPAVQGAPYKDVNNNGSYEPATDIPGVPGADQTIWYVANDLDAPTTRGLYGTNPLGIEMQCTIWGYNQTGALGSMFFRKYKLINRSVNTFQDMYVSMWSDVDLGNSTDDFAGCDTTLSLGYCYNANAADAVYQPLPPPAVGFDFFQGPVQNGVAGQDRNKNGVDDAADFAIFNGKKIGPGKINLPMTSFYYFTRGDASVTDPTLGDAQGSTQFYNFFQGKIGLTGKFFYDPVRGDSTTYALNGDPQTRRGWVDGAQQPAGDRRIGMASGPFNMAPNDTQEVVVAEIVAGALPGVDRLSAIGLLKFYDQQAQNAYDNFFDLPTAPPAPEVAIPGTKVGDIYYSLNKQIVLNWGTDLAKVQATENSNTKGYKFEGYNVYQLPSASASVSEGKLIATFDVPNGVLKISDQFFDPKTGVVAIGVRQFGNDTGIKRFFNVTTDELEGGTPLINGKRYYFAVTSYSYNAGGVPNNLENPVKAFTIIPSTQNPGIRYGAGYSDTVKVTHSKGVSEGGVFPIVVDPSKLNGHSYKVTFDTTGGTTTWKLTDVTLNKVILSGMTNTSGDDDYYTVDGMLIKVTGPAAPGMKDWAIPSGTRRFTWANADGFGLEGFNATMGNAYDHWFSGSTVDYSKLKNVLLKLTATSAAGVADPADPNISFGYRYLRRAAVAPADPSFVPFIVNPSAGYAYQDFKKNFPFAAYDMEQTPPRRLAVGYLENNVTLGLVDGKYWPPFNGDATRQNVDANGPREWFFIFDVDYAETANPALTKDILNNTVPMMWMGTVARRQEAPWVAGDQFMIYANHINTVNDEFTFVAPNAASFNAATAKADIEKINVFPNPYYGANPEELNKYNRFVTFSHLPAKAVIRIFNLAGILVRTITKNSDSQFERWDLANENGLPVASGLYLAYIDMPDLGVTKTIKLAIIQEQQILDRF